MYSENDWWSFLAHHGIRGQKWGVRNGPPYPLAAGSHSAAEKRAMNNKSEKKVGFVEELIVFSPMLMELAVWAAIGTAAAIHGVKVKRFQKKCEEERENAPVDKKTGLKKKTTTLSREEDVKRVNPEYETNPGGARSNCTNCTMAYELRRRGYEVQAKLRSNGRSEKFTKEMFPKVKDVKVVTAPDRKKDEDAFLRYMNEYEPKAAAGRNTECSQKTINALKSEPPGSRGQILVGWNRWSGHSMAYEITSDGKVNIIDGQIGKIYNEKDSEKLLRHCVDTQYERLDNLDFDVKKMKEAVR